MNIYQVSQVTGTTGTTITFPGLANLGYLFVQNQIGNASVQVALTNDFSVANNIFATLAAEEFCLIPMAKTSAPSLYVRPITATTPSIVVAATEI